MKENTQTKAESEKLKAENKKTKVKIFIEKDVTNQEKERGRGKNIPHSSILTPHSKERTESLEEGPVPYIT